MIDRKTKLLSTTCEPEAQKASDFDGPQAITPVITEAEPNGTSGMSGQVNRADFVVSDNPNLANDDLPSITIAGTVSTPSDVDFYRIDLNAGELIIIDVDKVTGGLDAFVKLYLGTSAIATNDDLVTVDPGSNPHPEYGHNTDSFIQLRVPFTGTYYVSVGSFQDPEHPTSGAYQLNLSVGPAVSRAELHEENVESLLSGAEWSTSTVTYSFPTASSQYGSDGAKEIAGGFSPLTINQIGTVKSILAAVSELTNLSFSELTANPGSAQMRFARSGEPDTAHAYYPGSGNGGDSWYNTGAYLGPNVGNYAYLTFLHETGHALGLEHGHESPFALSWFEDTLEYSVMTYRSYVQAPVDDDGGYTNETFGYPQTFMMYDIAALQRSYGADFTFNAGDSVYSWNPNSGAFLINGVEKHEPGANRVFMTIWDGGGTDTYDLSNYSSGVTIDLRPGEWTTTSAVQLANLGDNRFAVGNVANALLYNNDVRSLIENAVGGVGNDSLFGNQANNSLDGGFGNDLLDGGLGDDLLLLHGGGNDDARGGGGSDIFFYGGALTAADVNDGGEGVDTLVLQGNYNLQLGAASLTGLEGISVQSGSITRWGQSGTNAYDYSLAVLDSNVAAGQQLRVNAQSLQAGEDLTFNGSAETDGLFLVFGGFGIDQLTGGAQTDIFFFEAGRFGQGDVINGGLGDDAVVISGSAVGSASLSATIFAGTFQSIEALSFNGRFASDPNARPSYDVVLQDGNIAANAQLIVNGSSLIAAQSLAFDASLVSSGRLTVFGGAGADQLKGGANGDIFYAAGGADLLTGGSGADTFQYRSVVDSALGTHDTILDFSRGTDRIDLSAIDANSAASGNQAFTFIGSSAFTNGGGQLRSVASGNGSWFVEGDVDGNGVADFRIEVFMPGETNPLTATDFSM